MKRLMIAATALLGLSLSGAVAQDEMMAEGPSLSFGGDAQMGVIYAGDAENKAGTTLSHGSITWNAELDVDISASGVTDGGLTFGASTTINAEVGANAVKPEASGDEVETPDVYIGGEVWKITVGSPDKASELAFSLPDIGYDGLGVDDVAENIAKLPGATITTGNAAYSNTAALNANQVRVDVTLGGATVAISAGQTAGKAFKKGTPRQWANTFTYYPTAAPTDGSTRTTKFLTINTAFSTATPGTVALAAASGNVRGETHTATNKSRHFVTITPDGGSPGEFKDTDKKSYYWVPGAGAAGGTIYKVNGMADLDPGTANKATESVDDDGDPDTAAASDADTADTVVQTGVFGVVVNNSNQINYVRKEIAAVAEQLATKQKTNWAAGVSIPIGPASLGFGVDSEKAIMASVGAELGMVSGSLFYGQRELSDTVKPKSVGAEVGFSAGEGTTINAVVSQYDPDMAKDNQKLQGFGVGISHDLGGGAEIQAGFAKVDGRSGTSFVDGQTKASVGVTMAF